jgi:hypothetical protein
MEKLSKIHVIYLIKIKKPIFIYMESFQKMISQIIQNYTAMVQKIQFPIIEIVIQMIQN